jgi:hypothetical protein
MKTLFIFLIFIFRQTKSLTVIDGPIVENFVHCRSKLSPETYNISGKIISAYDPYLCQYDNEVAIKLNQSIENEIVLADIGNCDLYDKIKIAYLYNVKALIIGEVSDDFPMLPLNSNSSMLIVSIQRKIYINITKNLNYSSVIGFLENSAYDDGCITTIDPPKVDPPKVDPPKNQNSTQSNGFPTFAYIFLVPMFILIFGSMSRRRSEISISHIDRRTDPVLHPNPRSHRYSRDNRLTSANPNPTKTENQTSQKVEVISVQTETNNQVNHIQPKKSETRPQHELSQIANKDRLIDDQAINIDQPFIV